MKILVTGGAGFIGSNLVKSLLDINYEVLILDNFLTGKIGNIDDVDVEIIEGDIRNISTIKKAADNVDYILHNAALPSVSRSIENPGITNDINITGTLNVLIASKEIGVKRVIFASSSSIYGLNSLPQMENMNPMPLSPYAITKLIGEYYCKVFYDIYGLETVSLRYFNVFGPWQDQMSQYATVIPRFITSILKKEKPTIFGDGNQSRDFTYVKNIIEANILAMRAKNAAGEIFNIGCGESTTLNKLAKEINEQIDSSIEPAYTEAKKGDIRHSLADISKAKKILKYSPKYSLKQGLKETIEWYSDNNVC